MTYSESLSLLALGMGAFLVAHVVSRLQSRARGCIRPPAPRAAHPFSAWAIRSSIGVMGRSR